MTKYINKWPPILYYNKKLTTLTLIIFSRVMLENDILASHFKPKFITYNRNIRKCE